MDFALIRLLALASCFFCTIGFAEQSEQSYDASVKRVIDGDSLTVRDAQGNTREIRISAIDAPEHGQPWSRRSRAALRRMLGSARLTVVPVDTDRYQREVVELYRGSTNVGHAMVAEGFAWAYRRYVRDARLLDLEKAAREARRGIWSDPLAHRVAPWNWRSSLSTPKGGLGAPVLGNRRTLVYHLPTGCPGYKQITRQHRRRFNSAQAAENAGYRLAENCDAIDRRGSSSDSGDVDGPVIGNRRSRIFHWSGCPGYDRVSRKNRVRFKSAKDARTAHYRAARNCR